MDVADVKKILRALKAAPIDSKIVGARESLMQRDIIVNAANESKFAGNKFSKKQIEDTWGVAGEQDTSLSVEDQAYNDMVASAKASGQDPRKYSGAFMADSAVVKLQPKLAEQAPVKVAHPFNPTEVFQFPAGTDEKKAKELVRQIIIKRVREGEEKIDLPSNLPGERPPLDTSEK